MARSGLSLAQAADKAATGGEDADVSSMQLRPRLRGGSSARHLGSSSAAAAGCASALELPPIEGSTAGVKAANALRMADAAMADARQKVGALARFAAPRMPTAGSSIMLHTTLAGPAAHARKHASAA